MNKWISVIAIVEGRTEKIFISKLLAPYLERKNIEINATLVTKPGKKGGDVRFERVKKDIEKHLKQYSERYVTTMVDYYGTNKEWPGLRDVPPNAEPSTIAQTINDATKKEVGTLCGDQRAKRFIPNMSIHEFEALLFSDSVKLASELNIQKEAVDQVLHECREPEAINNNYNTTPSKRLDNLSKKPFRKITAGIDIATAIGIEAMRQKCPVFDAWLRKLEALHTV